MNTFLRYLSYLALAVTLIAPFFVYLGRLTLDTYYPIMTGAMVVWFASAVCWIKPHRHEE